MIEIYSKPMCSYCAMAKKLCEQQGYEFTYKMLGKDFTREELFELFPESKTFPQIRIDGQNIGGYAQLREWDSAYCLKHNKTQYSGHSGNWIGVGTAIGAVIFAATSEPVWLAVGVAVGAALSWQSTRK